MADTGSDTSSTPSLLRWRLDKALPNRCIKCNCDTEEPRVTVKMLWVSWPARLWWTCLPIAGFSLENGLGVPYAFIVSMVLSALVANVIVERHTVSVCICRQHRNQHRLRKAAWTPAGAVLGVVLYAVVTFIISGGLPRFHSLTYIIGGFYAMVGGIVGYYCSSHLLSLKRVAEDIVWFKGCAPEFIEGVLADRWDGRSPTGTTSPLAPAKCVHCGSILTREERDSTNCPRCDKPFFPAPARAVLRVGAPLVVMACLICLPAWPSAWSWISTRVSGGTCDIRISMERISGRDAESFERRITVTNRGTGPVSILGITLNGEHELTETADGGDGKPARLPLTIQPGRKAGFTFYSSGISVVSSARPMTTESGYKKLIHTVAVRTDKGVQERVFEKR